MCNSIFINDKTLPKAEDGDKYEVKIKGVYRLDEDGTRKFDVTSIDGRDVVGPEEEESDCGCGEHDPDLMEQDAEDALRIFMIKTNKKG